MESIVEIFLRVQNVDFLNQYNNNKKKQMNHLSPLDRFTHDVYLFQLLKNATKLISYEDIDDNQLRSDMEQISFFRRNISLYKTSFIYPRHDVIDQRTHLRFVLQNYNTHLFNNTSCAKIMDHIEKKILYKSSIYQVFSDLVKKEIIRPISCTTEQVRYHDFMGKPIECGETKRKRFAKSYVADNPYLYEVRLDSLCFKHLFVRNESSVGTSYSIVDNAKCIVEEPEFMTNMMGKTKKTSLHGGEAIEVPIMCPVEIFIMNGLLYTHDHKRIAASLLAGHTHLPAVFNQNPHTIKKRSKGYHPQRCLYSPDDKSLLVFYGDEYFFLMGPDHIDILADASDFSSMVKFQRLSTHGSYLFPERDTLLADYQQYIDHVKKHEKRFSKNLSPQECQDPDLEMFDIELQQLRISGASISMLLTWEAHSPLFGNPVQEMWQNLRPDTRDMLERSYPWVASLTTAKNIVRYRKIQGPRTFFSCALEDLVLLLRTGGKYGLGTKQSYACVELTRWYFRNIRTCIKNFYFLHVCFSESNEFQLLLDYLLELQPEDHVRIEKRITGDIVLYYATQGLTEEAHYSELRPVQGMSFVVHLTEPYIAESILYKRSLPAKNTKRKKPRPLGSICCMGRYIHCIGHVQKDQDGSYYLDPVKWHTGKQRLYKRFQRRWGLVIDINKVYTYYLSMGIAWKDVCGINNQNTVIFFLDIPHEALVDVIVTADDLFSYTVETDTLCKCLKSVSI